MEKNNLTMGIIGAMICIILLGGLLMPAVSSSLVIVGDPITIENTHYTDTPEKYDELKNTTISLIVSSDSFDMKVNDIAINKSGIIKPIVISDTITIEVNTASQSEIITIVPHDGSTSKTISAGTESTTTIVFNSGAYTIESSLFESITGTFNWLYSVSEGGPYSYIFHRGNTNFYISDLGKDLVTAGYYSTGELDTPYSYKDGKLVLGNTDYTGSVSITSRLYEGTTDIYVANTPLVTINSGDVSESFTPYRYLIKSEINGHKDSGAAYSMIEVLPIIAIISMILAAAYVAFGRKY